MSFYNTEQLLIQSRVLYHFANPSDLITQYFLVNKSFMEHALIHLRTKPFCVFHYPLTHDVGRLGEKCYRLNTDTIDFFHHLKETLEPNRYPCMPQATTTQLQNWLYPYIELPAFNQHTGELISFRAPFDPDRDEDILHIKHSNTDIRTSSYTNQATAAPNSILKGRIRIDANCTNISLSGLTVDHSKTWGITIDDGSDVVLTDVDILSCVQSGIVVSGKGTKLMLKNCKIQDCIECGLEVENQAQVKMYNTKFNFCCDDTLQVSSGGVVDIYDVSENETYLSCNGDDDAGSNTYCIRVVNKGSKVIFHVNEEQANSICDVLNGKHGPFRTLKKGLVLFVEEDNNKQVKKKRRIR